MSFESLSSGKRIVVIGGVGAGLSEANKARRLRFDIEILVFEKSGHISYGARAFVPRIKGIEIKGIFTINTLQDGIETKDLIRKNVSRRALIIGSGHIGMEMAETLVMAGMDVTIAEREPDILGTMDEEITKI